MDTLRRVAFHVPRSPQAPCQKCALIIDIPKWPSQRKSVFLQPLTRAYAQVHRRTVLRASSTGIMASIHSTPTAQSLFLRSVMATSRSRTHALPSPTLSRATTTPNYTGTGRSSQTQTTVPSFTSSRRTVHLLHPCSRCTRPQICSPRSYSAMSLPPSPTRPALALWNRTAHGNGPPQA